MVNLTVFSQQIKTAFDSAFTLAFSAIKSNLKAQNVHLLKNSAPGLPTPGVEHLQEVSRRILFNDLSLLKKIPFVACQSIKFETLFYTDKYL